MYVATLLMEANKLFNKKLSPGPNRLYLYTKTSSFSSNVNNRLATLVPLRSRHFPNRKQCLKIQMDCMV